jgi:glutathione peroxidase
MMNLQLRFVAAFMSAVISLSVVSHPIRLKSEAMGSESKLYAFDVKTIDGKQRSMAEYKGKVLLIVNVASKCGYTPQYKGLQEIYQKYKDKGFMILGFPSNDFLWQEPGSDEEIKQFCQTTYNVGFDMFSKIDVKGKNQHPLCRYLTRECEVPHEIKWNFNKFLVDRNGRVIAYYPSSSEPTDKEVTEKIEELIRSHN